MKTRHLILTAVVSVLLSLGTTAGAWFFLLRPPALVTFDLKGTMNAFIRQSTRLDLTDEQRRALMTRFDRSLTAATTGYAQDEHVSILVSPAVVTGLPDVTPDIQARLSALMKDGQAQQYPVFHP